MTINTTTPNAADHLKYVAAEALPLLDYAIDQLMQTTVDDPDIETALDGVRDILDAVKRIAVESAATFCRNGHDLDHYSDGRAIESKIELERGNEFRYRWHPQPDHRSNQPQQIAGVVTTTSGQRKQIVIAALGVLDAVDAGPGLRLVTDSEDDR